MDVALKVLVGRFVLKPAQIGGLGALWPQHPVEQGLTPCMHGEESSTPTPDEIRNPLRLRHERCHASEQTCGAP